MQVGASTCAGMSLGSILQDPGAIVDPTSLRPILFEWNGVDARQFIQPDSLQIQDTLGQPVTAAFVLVNPASVPVVGDKVRIFYHAQLIFAGTIDHVEKTAPDLRTVFYRVDCLDWTQTLIRRKVQRNFTNMPIQNVLDSLLDNELADEALRIGTIESRATLPLVDSRSGKALDVCREMAAATGQTFYLEFDRSIQMRSTLAAAAPLVLNEANVLLAATSVQTDRETYRNVQRVTVTGTPQVQNQDALTTQQERRNDDQIAARQAIEGGSGRYEAVEEITHPTSNDGAEIALLGISYARLRLATSGTPRTTARCQVRGYGFRAGQVATVALPTFGLSGTFAVQRVTIREQAGTLLFHELELTTSSLQQRAYESWLGIVQGAKVTVQVPGSLTNNLETFTTPGTTTWTVPAGVTTVEFTSVGGSGGGSESWVFATYSNYGNGGPGGASGKAISIVDVIEGAVFDLVIGAAGTASLGIAQSGEASVVSLSGVVKCQGDGGGGGHPAYLSGSSVIAGPPGSNGAGVGDAVSVGGGVAGGLGATAVPIAPAMNGQDGRVEVRW
ncbi:MAG: hypothetical protein ACRCTG_11165 [Aestuariivirga sp.]